MIVHGKSATRGARLWAVALVAGLGFFGTWTSEGSPTWVGLALAEEVRVQVDVIQGSQGGSGIDGSVKKHSNVVARIPGYGGWKLVSSVPFKLAPGKSGSSKVASRTLQVTVDELSGGKVKTTVVVVDPNGKPHRVTSSLRSGGTTVLTAQSADGKTVHLFVVAVSW